MVSCNFPKQTDRKLAEKGEERKSYRYQRSSATGERYRLTLIQKLS